MKKNRIKKIIKCILFIIYIIALFYFLFFAEALGRMDVPDTYRYNLMPFKEIKRFITYHKQLGYLAVILNIGGNIIAFIPFGFCLPSISEHRIKFFSCVMYTFALSFCVEIIQLVTKVGSCDVDDIILNTAGGLIGYVVYVIYKILFKKKRSGKK